MDGPFSVAFCYNVAIQDNILELGSMPNLRVLNCSYEEVAQRENWQDRRDDHEMDLVLKRSWVAGGQALQDWCRRGIHSDRETRRRPTYAPPKRSDNSFSFAVTRLGVRASEGVFSMPSVSLLLS